MIGRGSHVVTFRIRVPTRLTDRQRRIFEELAKEEQQQGGSQEED